MRSTGLIALFAAGASLVSGAQVTTDDVTTTLTQTATNTITITRCNPTVTNCPARHTSVPALNTTMARNTTTAMWHMPNTTSLVLSTGTLMPTTIVTVAPFTQPSQTPAGNPTQQAPSSTPTHGAANGLVAQGGFAAAAVLAALLVLN